MFRIDLLNGGGLIQAGRENNLATRHIRMKMQISIFIWKPLSLNRQIHYMAKIYIERKQ